jgi:Uncharacterized protein conserved in bacteria (DUF2330)
MSENETFCSGGRASPRALMFLKGLTSLGSRGRSPSRVLAMGFLLLLPIGALADGKMMSAFPANVTMPDQQALIHFTNGTERLVIETRFTGAGTNFAWVVPLPSQPVVEAATTGLFPTLRYLFQPRIIHKVPPYYVGFLMAIGSVAFLYATARARGWETVIGLLFGLPFLGLSLLLLSVFAHPGGPMGSAPEGAVSILDRRVVGVFDTMTLTSHDPKALQNWLRENGFALSADTAPVIESYVKQGWVFVTAKVRRDLPGLQTSTPHPLSFTFKTKRPVYPMRLTGINNGPLSVELYVFGPGRASARHFKTQRCIQPVYQEPEKWWAYRTPKTPNIVHPLLRQWVGGSPVATRLTATLTPANMQQDVWLDWEPFREKSSRVYSREAACNYALNRGVGLFAAVLFVALIAADASQRMRPRLRKLAAAVTVAGIALTGILYLALPKTEVRLVREPGGMAEKHLDILYDALQEETNLTPFSVEAIVLGLTNSPFVQGRIHDYGIRYGENLLLGGTLRQEDSPGNYTMRETTNGLDFIGYDAQGTERVLGSIPRQAR